MSIDHVSIQAGDYQRSIAFYTKALAPLGISGMPRRIAVYAPEPIWVFLNLVSTVWAFLIAASILPFLVNVVATFINGERVGDDPWEGNTLEWATTSPPPPYNFDTLPPVRSERPVFDLRHKHDVEHLSEQHLPVSAPADEEGNVAGQPDEEGAAK